MDKIYDFIIIGGGIGGLAFAYKALESNKGLKICLIEKGNRLGDRVCPALEFGKACIQCSKCSIMSGMAGAGAFSDGKFNITTEFGGWLTDYISEADVMKYILELDELILKFGATNKLYEPSNDLKQYFVKYGLNLLQAKVRHIGSDGNLLVMRNLIADLQKSVDILPNNKVGTVDTKAKWVDVAGDKFYYDKLVIASGRSGAVWFSDFCQQNGIQLNNNQIDLGIRVELPREVWEDVSKQIYEPKIVYTTKQYGDRCRMFCFNSGGSVVYENVDGTITVNGHANSNEKEKTNLSNFALLSSSNFTQPFTKPIDYVNHICTLSNMLSGGNVIVQRFGDLIRGRRTTDERLAKGSFQPTLKAVAGDLSLCIPKRQLDNIIETLLALEKAINGTAHDDTLLYGIEAKFYSARPEFSNSEVFEIMPDIHVVGDGSGVTRSLAQAGAMGMYLADKLLNDWIEY